MNFYVGSFGPQYGDPIATLTAFDRLSLEELLDRAVEDEIALCASLCNIEHNAESPTEDCSLCNADVVSYGAWYTPSPVRSGIVGSFGELLRLVRQMRIHPNGVGVLARW